MNFVAIVERRSMHRFVHIPALDTGRPLPHRDEPREFATALIAAALGMPEPDLQVTLHHASLGETLVPTAPVEVQILHDDGAWRTAQHTGWLRHWHGSWGPLVTYTAEGISWTRAVHMSRMRQPFPEVLVVPSPRQPRMAEPQPAG